MPRKSFSSVLPILFMISTTFLTSCGGGGSGGQNNSASPTDGGSGDETYADIYNANGIHLKTSRLPSQFNTNSDIAICQVGETYALDKCWQNLTINADTKSITVENINGNNETLFEYNKELNSNLKEFYNMHIASSYDTKICDPTTSLYGQCYETFANAGSASQYFQIPYLPDSGVSNPRVSFRSIAGEWSASSLPENTPWATSNEITLDKTSTNPISFGIKTTFAYGLVQNSSTYISQYKIAHYWDLKGSLVINSKTYSFPLTFSTLEKDMILEDVGSQTGYMDAKRIQVGDIYIIFYPEKNSKYSYLDYISGADKSTDKIRGIVITPKWDNNNF